MRAGTPSGSPALLGGCGGSAGYINAGVGSAPAIISTLRCEGATVPLPFHTAAKARQLHAVTTQLSSFAND